MAYYEGIDYWVRYVEFPNAASPSLAVSNGDGTFNIYVNTLFCPGKQAEALEHELKHLSEEHFFRDDMTIVQIEHRACGIKDADSVLPNVFDHQPGVIPIFNSLESFKNYMYAMRMQTQSEKAAGER